MCCTDLKYVWHNHDEIRFVPQNAGCWTHQLCWDPHSKHLAYIWCLLLSELPTTCLIYSAGVFWLDAHTNHSVCYNTWIYCYHIGLIIRYSGAQSMLILVMRPEDNFLDFFYWSQVTSAETASLSASFMSCHSRQIPSKAHSNQDQRQYINDTD